MSKRLQFSLTLLACLSFAAASGATTLPLEGCDVSECHNLGLTLTTQNQGGGVFLVTYTINTTAYDDTFVGLTQLGFQTIQNYSSQELLTAPGGLGNWSDAINAPVNSNGALCSPSGSSNKVCVSAENSLFDLRVNGIYEWTFKIVGGTELPTSQWVFSGQFANVVGAARGNIISQSAPAVPEPTAALLFGLGALTVGRSLRRQPRRA